MVMVRSGPGVRIPPWERLLANIAVVFHLGGFIAQHRYHAHYMADAGSAHIEQTAAAPDEFSSFETCFQRYTTEITGYLWRMTCDEQVAQDLAQETFLRAWKHFGELREYQQPRAWLFRVATNLALNHLRQRTRWQKKLFSPTSRRKVDTPEGFHEAEGDITTTSLVTGDHAAEVVEREAVRETLLALPITYRAALVLRSVYGMDYSDIGTVLDMSAGAARTTLCRSRERFRMLYLEQHDKREEAQP